MATKSGYMHKENRAMREAFLKACYDMQQAPDEETAEEHKKIAQSIGQDFVAANQRLAYAHAKSLLRGTASEDIAAAAMLGLWEAFVGTVPENVYKVNVDKKTGKISPVQGWDPDSGTFGTWAKLHVSGKARRAVASHEVEYQGVSYGGFQKIPLIRKAAAELREEGVTPTNEEIAKRAGVTTKMVASVLTPTPMSLSTPVGDDGHATLNDVVADSQNEPESNLDVRLQDHHASLDIDELIAWSIKSGAIGLAPATGEKVAHAMGLSKGIVGRYTAKARENLEKQLS